MHHSAHVYRVMIAFVLGVLVTAVVLHFGLHSMLFQRSQVQIPDPATVEPLPESKPKVAVEPQESKPKVAEQLPALAAPENARIVSDPVPYAVPTTETPTRAKPKRTQKAQSAEREAYAKAYANAARANALLGEHRYLTGPSDKVATFKGVYPSIGVQLVRNESGAQGLQYGSPWR